MDRSGNGLDDAVSAALDAASGIDVLILNAGQYQCSPALETDLDEALPRLMQINFASLLHLSQKLVRRDGWKERRHGHIVVVSSLIGRGPLPLNAAYGATKHAVLAYFQSLASEERSWLRVDVVLPGVTDTDLWASSLRPTATTTSSFGGKRKSNGHDNSKGGQELLHADDRSKMCVARCAQLIVSTMVGPVYSETWITRNPGLVWVHLASYAPMTHHLFTNMLGPIRMNLLKKNREDALYLPSFLWELWLYILEHVTGRSDRLLQES